MNTRPALLLASLLSSSLLHAAQEEFEVVTLEAGAPAPTFTLPGCDGKDHALSDYADKKFILLAFTCNHCPDARAARDRINTFAQNYAAKGVQVIAIASAAPSGVQTWENGYTIYGDSFDEMKIAAKEYDLQHPYLYDGETQITSRAYGAKATPHCFLLGPPSPNANGQRTILYQGQFDNGRRRFGPSGPAFDNVVIDNIDLLLAGKELTKKKTRAYGCSTKWAWKKKLVEKANAQWDALPVTLDTLDDATAKTLAENKTGRLKVINLWSTTCGPCVAEFPDLIDTYRRYHRRPVDLITISVDPLDDKDKVLKFLQDQHLPTAPHTAKALQSEGRSTNNYLYHSPDLDPLADALHPDWSGALPLTIVIAPGGKTIFTHEGHLNPIPLRKAIITQLESQDTGKH